MINLCRFILKANLKPNLNLYFNIKQSKMNKLLRLTSKCRLSKKKLKIHIIQISSTNSHKISSNNQTLYIKIMVILHKLIKAIHIHHLMIMNDNQKLIDLIRLCI